MANTPYEIIVSPYEVYITTVTSPTWPGPADTPGTGEWVLMGTNGKNNMVEGGVTVEHGQTLVPVRVEGRTGPVKLVRTEDNQVVRFSLMDLSRNHFKWALSGDDPDTISSTEHEVGLSRAEAVREVALLIKGPSPAANNKNAQYEIPRAVQSGAPRIQFAKGTPSSVNFEFVTLEDLNAAVTGERFGRFVIGS